jgi:formylglycine-generating enzyme required for sulfatase activity
MDKFEVSNAKFADYLNHSNVLLNNNHVYQVGGAAQLICGLSYGLQHDGNAFVIDAGKDNHPVIFLTWYGATLYCNYLSTAQGRMPCYDATTFACDFTADGFRLPTEAEWEYASRGDEHNPYYKFPWGSDAISSTDANYGSNTSIGTTTDVGSYSANSYGLYDMAGNAVEWCNDWYDSAYYANASVSNPSGPNSGALRVARGGGWYDSGFSLRCAFRAGSAPSIRNYGVGFRAVAAQ